MFGGLILPKKPPLRERVGLDVPGTKANSCGHMAPYDNSQYAHRMMLYEQRKEEFQLKYADNIKEIVRKDAIAVKYMKHAEKKSYERAVKKRAEKKFVEYEENIEKRRLKLADLLYQEERAQIKEAVDLAQRGQEDMLLQKKIRTQELRAQRENERLELVRQKKLQQYLNKCEEFRPVVAQRRLIESKQGQLQQIRENESRKESERELEHFWYDMLMKEIRAQAEREEQDKLARRKRLAEDTQIWELQKKSLQVQRENQIREVREDAIRLNNLKEQMLRDEIEALDKKRRKRDQILRDLTTQIRDKEAALERQALADKAETESYGKLQLIEIEREKKSSLKPILRQEMQQYRDYIARLEQERRDEEKRIEELIALELKAIQEKQDDARCKLIKAKEALQKDVMQGREIQLKYKQEEAQQQLRKKEAENELIRLAFEQNERMRAEYARQKHLAAKQYEADLKKQMEYNELKKEREKEELERLLAAGKAEEDEYRRIVAQLMTTEASTAVHPFRQVLIHENCPCPKTLY